MDFIEQNNDSVSLAETDARKNIAADVNCAIEDLLFLNFLLLDVASVWPQLRFENTLVTLEALCIAWTHKFNDIFDSCFQLLKDYCTG